MAQPKNEIMRGTFSLMVLKTLNTLGPLHGYGIARRIEQISGDVVQLNQGTIYPALLHWNRWAGLNRSGACPTITAKPSTTRLPAKALSSFPQKRVGAGLPK